MFFSGRYEFVLPNYWQGSIPDVAQVDFYDRFDVIVLCVDLDYANAVTYPPPPSKIIYAFNPDDLYTCLGFVLQQVDEVVARLRKGEKTLCVCTTGMNRSSAFSVLLLYRMGFPIERAVDRVYSLRHGPEGSKELIKLVKDYEVSKPLT